MSDNKTVDIRGLLDTYEFPCKLPGSGAELMIKPITTGQMKKILVFEEEPEDHIVEHALDDLITSCVVNEDFNIDDLYLQDRFHLLLEVRKVTKGRGYSFNFKCPKCNVENFKSMSLDDLATKPRDEVNNIIRVGEKISLEVDFPTRLDQKEAVVRVTTNKELKGAEKRIEIITATFANCIKKIHTKGGVLDNVSFEDKVYILDNITSDKYDVFKTWFDDNDFGTEFVIEVGCNHCKFKDKMSIPLSDFFV